LCERGQALATALANTVAHVNERYVNIAVYLRLKCVVPLSSENMRPPGPPPSR
jgi:hypothetical protein